MNDELNEFMGRMLLEFQADQIDTMRERAKRDPVGNKMVKVFDKGPGYKYFRGCGTDGRGRTVQFCYSVHRNVAGYFLGWREMLTKKGGSTWKRDKWVASRKKYRVIDIARNRTKAHRAKMETKS